MKSGEPLKADKWQVYFYPDPSGEKPPEYRRKILIKPWPEKMILSGNMEVLNTMKNLEEAEEFFEEKYQKDPEFKETWDEMELQYHLAREIIKRRSELGLTQKELAERIGTEQSVISRIENGHNCNLETINKIAKSLNSKPRIHFEAI